MSSIYITIEMGFFLVMNMKNYIYLKINLIADISAINPIKATRTQILPE